MRSRNVALASFLSTFPLRGTSETLKRIRREKHLSIHVPLAGNVVLGIALEYTHMTFYPRSPCGERHVAEAAARLYCELSIHVPLAGNVL